jgi:hypothetical protein
MEPEQFAWLTAALSRGEGAGRSGLDSPEYQS